MTDTTALLDAGAYLPVKTKIPAGEPVDAISARHYTHPALGDRAVVRLSPDNLAMGDDLEMEFLGFAAPGVGEPVAVRRRQALGFPGWALVNDPEHARYALELVKDFKKAARRARSKPGHAYDAFVATAKQLGRGVAHFLPSYWEQAGREFMELGNATYASRCFTKAREAERVHALKVDEQLRKDVFLEFALAGCLSNKVLIEYGKDLQKSHTPQEAWTFFRELCVRRTLGGMPPWTSSAKDLQSLVSGAKLDPTTELELFLIEILESPAMSRAPMGFWKGCGKIIPDLAAKNPQVAGQLLNILPETSRWDQDNAWKWLENLEEWGLLENAWKSGVPKAAGLTDGTAAWFSRIAALSTSPPPIVFEIARRAASALKKQKQPVHLAVKGWNDFEICVDLLDLCLELGIPVADPPKDCEFDLNEWARCGDDDDDDDVAEKSSKDADRPRDPLYVAKDERFAKLLTEAVKSAAGSTEFEAAALGKTALAAARKEWLLNLTQQISNGAIPDAETALNQLENNTSRATFKEFPECYASLKKAELVSPLMRNLQGGILDEYGWPILEEVVNRLNPDGKQELQFFGAFPHVIVTDQQTAIVVNTTEIVLEHELRLPKKAKFEDLMFYDGQLCVFFEAAKYQDSFYWSDNPKKVFEEWHYGSPGVQGATVNLADGGTFSGRRTIHAGDSKDVRSPDKFAFDGEHFWTLEWRNEGQAFREIAPATGKTGRWSMPSFFEDYITSDAELDADECELLHFGEFINKSPLGAKNGLVGWRSRKHKHGKLECEGIDGRQWTGENTTAVALLDQPGTNEKLPLFGGWWHTRYASVSDPSGKYQLASFDDDVGGYNAGQATPLPFVAWHGLQVRDEKTSKLLRKTSATQAKTLLKAAADDLDAVDFDSEEELQSPKTATAVKKWLKGLKHARFQRGVEGLVIHAARQAERLTALIEQRDPSGKDARDYDPTLEASVIPAMKLLDISTGWGETKPLTPHLQDVVAFFTGTRESGNPLLVEQPFEWYEIFEKLESGLWSSYWSADEDDNGWLTFLEFWAGLPLQDLPGKFRTISGEFDGKPPFGIKRKDYDDLCIAHTYQGNFYMMVCQWGDDWTGLEYAPTGKFKVLPKHTLDDENVLERTWSSERLLQFVELMRANSKPFLDAETVADVAEKTGISGAEVGLLWFGCPNFNSWEKNFLPKALRESLNLKVAQAEAARNSLRSLPDGSLTKLQQALLDGDPEDLWKTGGESAVYRLVRAWDRVVPKRLQLPAKTADQLTDAFHYQVDNSAMLVALASPKTSPHFQTDGTWEFRKDDDDWRPELKCSKPDANFDAGVLSAVVTALPFLAYHLPEGDLARMQMADAYEQALKCLKSPKLLIPICEHYIYDDKDEDAAGKKLLEKVMGKSKKSGDGWIVDDGTFVGYAYEDCVHIAARPAKLKSDADFAKARQLAAMIGHGDFDEDDCDAVKEMHLLQSDGFAALAKFLRKNDLQDEQYAQNPLHSVPKLVAEVSKTHDLTEDAAVLYLQLLTLHDPTTANVKLWNGWATAAVTKAAKQLVDKKLVLAAKRSRAGRGHFLPGGWEALKLPHLPVETWKLPLYEILRDKHGQLTYPVQRILPLQPLPELFATAWTRTQTGDAPAYEEVK